MSRPVGNHRLIGNTRDRRARENWMISMFGSTTFKTIFCFHCGKRMRSKTLRRNRKTGVLERARCWEIDRYPVCGHDGGRYTRDNIVPSCRACNGSRCTTVFKCRQGAPVLPRFSRKVAA